MEKKALVQIVREAENQLTLLRNDFLEMLKDIPELQREAFISFLVDESLQALLNEEETEFGAIKTTGYFQALLWASEECLRNE